MWAVYVREFIPGRAHVKLLPIRIVNDIRYVVHEAVYVGLGFPVHDLRHFIGVEDLYADAVSQVVVVTQLRVR